MGTVRERGVEGGEEENVGVSGRRERWQREAGGTGCSGRDGGNGGCWAKGGLRGHQRRVWRERRMLGSGSCSEGWEEKEGKWGGGKKEE